MPKKSTDNLRAAAVQCSNFSMLVVLCDRRGCGWRRGCRKCASMRNFSQQALCYGIIFTRGIIIRASGVFLRLHRAWFTGAVAFLHRKCEEKNLPHPAWCKNATFLQRDFFHNRIFCDANWTMLCFSVVCECWHKPCSQGFSSGREFRKAQARMTRTSLTHA